MRFYTRCLLSKWGFGDGSMLDDLIFDAGIELDEHELLIRVVRSFVLPQIDQHVDVFEIGSIHNPIRADAVDGKKVDNYSDDHGVPPLTPEFVDVPDDVILRLARSMVKPSPQSASADAREK